MDVRRSIFFPIRGASPELGYEYGLDSLNRITYLQFNELQETTHPDTGQPLRFAIRLQPIILPSKKSYITRALDFAGPIIGFYSEAPSNYLETPLSGFDTIGPSQKEAEETERLRQLGIRTNELKLKFRKLILDCYPDLSSSEIDVIIESIMPPQMTADNTSLLDFAGTLGVDKVSDLKTRLKFMPRYAVEEMIWEMVKPSLVKTSGQVGSLYSSPASYLAKNYSLMSVAVTNISSAFVVSHMLHLFNHANIKALEENTILDPYLWEDKKSKSFQRKDIDSDLSKAVFNVLSPEAAKTLADHDQMIASFGKRIESLPQMKDKGIQLQRDTALAGFLGQENFEELNMLLSYYENLPESYKEAIRNT